MKLNDIRDKCKGETTYTSSGNLRVDGNQYSKCPLASADITTSWTWLYFITFTGPP
jgi:hypothetical protein